MSKVGVMLCACYIQIKEEDIYDGLGIYTKPATVENELYAQLKTFNITNILHSQVRFVHDLKNQSTSHT